MRFNELTQKLPSLAKAKMVSQGIGLWITWSGDLPQSVPQTFLEFGGIHVSQEKSQALWYFFGDEAYRAVARVVALGKVNPFKLHGRLFTATLLMGFRMEQSLSVSDEILDQDVPPPDDFYIWLHPNLKGQLSNLPGLTSKPTSIVTPGMARVAWEEFHADSTLSYEPGLGWYFLIRPLGDPLDKNYAEGWRGLFSELQGLMERLGIKYLVHDGFIIFPLESLRALKNFLRDLLKALSAIKQGIEGRKYWPCVIACVTKKGFNLNKDLPKKINLDWKMLAPDYPHVSIRTALQLADGFEFSEVNYANKLGSFDDWCTISMSAAGADADNGQSVSLNLPKEITNGRESHCFYCGLTNHLPRNCPTKILSEPGNELWDRIARVDMEAMQQGLEDLAGHLIPDPASPPSSMDLAMEEQLVRGGLPALLLGGILDVNETCQHRFLRLIWRSRGRDLPAGLTQLNPLEQESYVAVMDAMRGDEREGIENLIVESLAKHPRMYHTRPIQGLFFMEDKDWIKAVYYWQEAGRLSYTAMHRGYHLLLQGRAAEVQIDFPKAISLYKQAAKECPRWFAPLYREGVCLVKMGFADQAMGLFLDLVNQEPHIFNMLLLDAELERGRYQVMAGLWQPWQTAHNEATATAESFTELNASIKAWIPEDKPFLEEALGRLESLKKLAAIKNYVAFKQLKAGSDILQRDFKATIDKEVAIVLAKVKRRIEDLKGIHKDAAWFPFRKLLREFNQDFNYCASKLNWMRTSPMQVAENFRQSLDYLTEVDERLKILRGRLVSLRIVRDATLFVLMLGRNFVWLQVIALGLSLLLIPAFIILAQKMGADWLADMVGRQKWQLQKGLILILSILAMALAAIKTALTFDKKKAAILREQEEKAEKEAEERQKLLDQRKTQREEKRKAGLAVLKSANQPAAAGEQKK